MSCLARYACIECWGYAGTCFLMDLKRQRVVEVNRGEAEERRGSIEQIEDEESEIRERREEEEEGDTKDNTKDAH